MKHVEDSIEDVIIGRPNGFSVGRKHFYLYPVTFAKMFLLKRLVQNLGLDQELLKMNPYLEAIRLAKTNRQTCCQILAYHTSPNTYKDLFDQRAYNQRYNYFTKELADEDLASMMIMVLTSDKTDEYIAHLGLDKEHEKLQKVMAIKANHDNNTLSFGGKSLFGTFIHQLKEMGYTDNEILYERGYSYLRLMLADKVVTVHLSDEEKQEIPNQFGGNFYDANNPENADKIRAVLANLGVAQVQPETEDTNADSNADSKAEVKAEGEGVD